MNWKTLLVLLILAGAAVYGVVQLKPQQQGAPTAASEPALLYPQLADQINDVNLIRIVKAGDTPVVELKHTEQGWVLANKDNYPASLDTLRELLSTLVDAKIVETKTSNPERYAALGVEDISAEDAQGMRIDLEGGSEPISLIVGNLNSSNQQQTYVRKADQAQSLLISGSLAPADDVQRWARQPIVAIPAEQVQKVVIKHPDGEQLTVYKSGRSDTNFKLFNLLEGRELSHDTVANPIGNALSNLRLEDVRTVEQLNPADAEPVITEYYTFDGRKITLQGFQQDDNYYLHLQAAFDADQFEQFRPKAEPATTDDSADESADDTESTANDEAATETAEADTAESDTDADKASDAEQLAQQMAELDAQLKPWVFAVSQYKYQSVSKRLEDLLKPEEKPAEDASPAAQTQPVTPVVTPAQTATPADSGTEETAVDTDAATETTDNAAE